MRKRVYVGILSVFARGIAMGIAEIVPGISGSTIALITGIYSRMINALASFSAASTMLLFREGWRPFYKRHDVGFLLVLLVGMAFSYWVLANVIADLLETRPLYVWGFFFGLVAAAVIQIGSSITWQVRSILTGVFGFLVGASFAFLPIHTTEPWLPLVFVGGLLAVAAWMLPGVSGSLVLLLLGLYGPMLAALTSLNLIVLSTFVLGLLVGVVVFARLIRHLFHHYRDGMLGFLTGLMAGSLMVLWPWRISTDLLWPTDYWTDPQWVGVTSLIVVGMATVFLLGFASRRVD